MNAHPAILVVDDEKDFASGLARMLKKNFPGHDCLACISADQALSWLRQTPVGVMLTDIRMPGTSGLKLMEKALADYPLLCVVLMTAYGTIEDAVKSLKQGAHDFITKPVDRDNLYRTVKKALAYHDLVCENQRLREMARDYHSNGTMIGETPAMTQLTESIAAVAATDYTVLIRGESGTGKELAAHSIHRRSNRARKPLLSVSCPAIPEQLLESELFGHVRGAFTGADKDRTGLFETAGGGTLLLDEIGDISPTIQAKLLRVLQEKEIRPVGSSRKKQVNVRILATTNQNLEKKISDGTFREDLFYRLNVLSLKMPPLSERCQDIPLLVHHFIGLTGREMALSPKEISADALAYLTTRPWPGNVRELLNFIRRLMVFCTGNTIGLPTVKFVENSAVGNGVPTDDMLPYKEAKSRVMNDFTEAYVRAVLHRTSGNISEAARLSSLERVSLQKILRRLNIDARSFYRQ